MAPKKDNKDTTASTRSATKRAATYEDNAFSGVSAEYKKMMLSIMTDADALTDSNMRAAMSCIVRDIRCLHAKLGAVEDQLQGCMAENEGLKKNCEKLSAANSSLKNANASLQSDLDKVREDLEKTKNDSNEKEAKVQAAIEDTKALSSKFGELQKNMNTPDGRQYSQRNEDAHQAGQRCET